MKVFLSLITLGLASALPSLENVACLRRQDVRIQAIVQGSINDPIVEQIRRSADQMARGMKVQLEWESIADLAIMESRIEQIKNHKIANKPEAPDALIVSIPSQEIAAAVKQVADAEIPVIGVNSGASLMKEAGIINMVAPDNKLIAELLAQQIKKRIQIPQSSSIIPKVLLVEEEPQNVDIEIRRQSLEIELGSEIQIERLIVDVASPDRIIADLKEKIQRPEQDGIVRPELAAIVLSGNKALEPAIRAIQELELDLAQIPVGVIDSSAIAYDAIENEQISFLIANQQYLQ